MGPDGVGPDDDDLEDDDLGHAETTDDAWGRARGGRWLLLLLVVPVVALVVHLARPAHEPVADPTPPATPTHTTSRPTGWTGEGQARKPAAGPVVQDVGHPLLGATADWELYVRGDHQVVRIQMARGRISTTPVPGLASGGPVTFLATDAGAVVRPLDPVRGYLVAAGRPARQLEDLLAEGGPVVPGPDPSHVWLQEAGNGTGPDRIRLVAVDGSPTSTSLRMPANAGGFIAPDGAGYPLVRSVGGAYSLHPGGPRRVTTGTVEAVGPTGWLVVECDHGIRCHRVVVDREGWPDPSPGAGQSACRRGRPHLTGWQPCSGPRLRTDRVECLVDRPAQRVTSPDLPARRGRPDWLRLDGLVTGQPVGVPRHQRHRPGRRPPDRRRERVRALPVHRPPGGRARPATRSHGGQDLQRLKRPRRLTTSRALNGYGAEVTHDDGFGWFSYSPLADNGPRHGMPAVYEAEPGLAPENAGVAAPAPELRPELADLGRLARRGLRGVVRAARADEQETLAGLAREHLGAAAQNADVLQETWPGYEQVNVQVGLDDWLEAPGREHRLIGVVGMRHQEFGLADLLQPEGPGYLPRPGGVSRLRLPSGPGGRTRAVVQCGLYLVTEGDRHTLLLLRGPESEMGRTSTTVQVASGDAEADAAVARELRRLADVHNVFRGQVLSFGGEIFGQGTGLLQFHERPTMSAEQLVLHPEVLAAIERQVIGVARHRERLIGAGQHLKRGLLLFGPPGVGKTHTIRYLTSILRETTVIQVTGESLHLIGEACSVARSLQPALVIVEDVDLIAGERGESPGEHPLLFQLLNEMDGLAEDADVAFVLTTNRADLLEPALASRPGRVDQAVEIELPDLTARRRLFDLYRGELDLDTTRLDSVLARAEGVTASFLKELLRRAAVLAATEDGDDATPTSPLHVSADQLDAALDDLLSTRNAMTRTLLGGSNGPRET